MILTDQSGKKYVLEGELARGGEGAVYRVRGYSDLLAKHYHKSAVTLEAKIATMIANPPGDPTLASQGHPSIPWPQVILYEGKRFAGFLMPLVKDAVPILDIYNPRRRSGLPWSKVVDQRYLHRVARNLASTVSALHAKGYVIGDINEGNILVKQDALISLIDTDSFQVPALPGQQSGFFHCPVGKEEFTPPDLQGAKFENTRRTQHHDSFGLGVIVFLLLMSGTHPFRSQWRGAGETPLMGQKIRLGLFPHQVPAIREAIPPRGAPSLLLLDPALQSVLLNCFVQGSHKPFIRPSAEAWEQAIKIAELNLIPCAHGHWYGKHIQACPWCTKQLKEALPNSTTLPKTKQLPRISPVPLAPRNFAPTATVPTSRFPDRLRSKRFIAATAAPLVIAMLWMLAALGDGTGDATGSSGTSTRVPTAISRSTRTVEAIAPAVYVQVQTGRGMGAYLRFSPNWDDYSENMILPEGALLEVVDHPDTPEGWYRIRVTASGRYGWIPAVLTSGAP